MVNLNGRGSLTTANGDRYEGDFVDGIFKKGRVTKTWANGDRYEGDVVVGKRTGRGIYVYRNGDRDEGDFVDDIFKKGRVTKTWANGNRYEGDWVDDEENGSGKIAKVNGDWYDGEWSGGFADGDGEAKNQRQKVTKASGLAVAYGARSSGRLGMCRDINVRRAGFRAWIMNKPVSSG